jgi:hypothetical protein
MRSVTVPLFIFMLFLLTADAFAGALRFDLYTSGGTETWDPTIGLLIGRNIAVKEVKGTETPLNTGVVFSLVDSFLNYTTSASPTWGWSGGTFTLTGCIVSTSLTIENNGTCDATDPTKNPILMSGNLLNVTMASTSSLTANVYGSLNGSFNPLLAAKFGMSTSFSEGFLSNDVYSATGFTQNSAFNATNAGGVVVPEDWSVSFAFIFFGFGLTTFGLASRLGILRWRFR